MAEQDLYRILGVSPTASEGKIRSAYRILVRKYHPDIYDGDPEVAHANFRHLTEAYEILIDPVRRKEYDHRRLSMPSAPPPNPRSSHRPSWESPHRIAVPRPNSAAWVHYPPPTPVWTRKDPHMLSARERVRQRWKVLNERVLGRPSLGRRVWRVFLIGFALFLVVAVSLAVIPVTQQFAFSETPICLLGYSSNSQDTFSFGQGDRVTFGWTTQASNYSSAGGGPPAIYLENGITGTVFSASTWNGTFSFYSDGADYSFNAVDCAGSANSVSFQGDYVGPLL